MSSWFVHTEAQGSRAYLKTNATMIWLSLFFIIISVMEAIETNHAAQFVAKSDAWMLEWNWVVLIPTAMLWLWAEAKAKYPLQFFAGVVFCLCGPTLLGGAMFREYSYFSFWEGELLFGGMVISLILFFFGYVPVKFSELFKHFAKE